MQLYQPTITGSLAVSGSVIVDGSITATTISGTLSGTASLATTASFAVVANSASYAASASNTLSAQSASYILNAQSASIATTALTASSADNFLVRNTLTAQTLVVQTITSSVDFVTGSTRFGSSGSNTHIFTGSMSVSGSGTFVGNIIAGDVIRVSGSGAYFTILDTQASSKNWAIRAGHDAVGDLAIRQSNSTGGDPVSAGTTRLYINASGSVGIGTSNPLSKLDVTVLASGARRLLVNYDDSIVTVKSANDSAGGETLRLIGDVIIFNTGSAGSGGEAMRLTNTGRVGIGTSSPSYKLHVYAPSSASYFDGGTTDTSFYISHGSYFPGQTVAGIRNNSGSPVLNAKNGGTLYFNRDINSANVEFQYNTGSATSLFISSSGLIGIGTGAPNNNLHIFGSGAGLNISGGNNRIYFGSARAIEGDGTQLQIGEGHAKTFFQTSTGGTVMTVTGSSVGIGLTNPSARFHNKGSFITENSNSRHYGEAKTFVFQSSFNNPTIDLITINSTSAYGAIMIRVTAYQNTVSTSRSNIHVGYANWAGDVYPTVNKGIIAPTVIAQFNGCTNVGTLAWSGNTLQYTGNRHTNYDGYIIVVEWGANIDHNAAPTYGGNLT
jgi:hypothetical protein